MTAAVIWIITFDWFRGNKARNVRYSDMNDVRYSKMNDVRNRLCGDMTFRMLQTLYFMFTNCP